MALQINQYPIERPKVGTDDFLDIDYWDGTQFRSAKIKAENVAKLEKLLDVSTLDSINIQNTQAEFLVKCDDGLYRNAEPSEWWHLMMQSGLKPTTPNIVNHNFDSIAVTSIGSWASLSAEGLPYTKISNSFGTQTFGEPLRMMNFGSAYVVLYANQNSNFVEVDNIFMQGWGGKVFIYGVQYSLLATNLVAISQITLNSQLMQVQAPNLKYLGSISATNTGNILDFPSVEYLNNVYVNGSVASVDFTNLRVARSFTLNSQSPTSFSLPNLEAIWNFAIKGCAYQSLSLPNLIYAENISITQNPQLTTIDISNLRVYYSTYIAFQFNALTQQSVDNILVTFANMDGQSSQYPLYFGNASFNINGGANSAPSQVGLNAIAILQSRGCSVATN